MTPNGKPLRSLRARLVITILVCWVVPIVMIVAVAGFLLRLNYENEMARRLETDAGYTLQQFAAHLDTAFTDSKSVSYDGVVRAAYRSWQQDGDKAALYRSVNEYLAQNFSREERYKAVFISFWEEVGIYPYVMSSGINSYSLPRNYHHSTEPIILDAMRDADTAIRFFAVNGDLYIARNLLDNRFQPYATVVQLVDGHMLSEILSSLPKDTHLSLDDLVLDAEGLHNQFDHTAGTYGFHFIGNLPEHTLTLDANLAPFDIFHDMPWLQNAILAVVLLVLPLLAVMILLFRKYVTRPVEVLVDATAHLQNGERGYQISDSPKSWEFQRIYRHFNSMSSELKNQFERSILEQQALQQARVKALQSQINPHFLNNTLEVINWEARLAGDDRVSAMIEALSVMLNAALDRDGRGQIPLREELSYVDAYLYIIRERLGERLTIEREIDETMLDALVPRLILQPLVENAVEHDLSARHGGLLCIRARRESSYIVLECEHDGTLSTEDLEQIKQMLSSDVADTSVSGQVGIRNVKQRLDLLYGEKGSITLCQSGDNSVLARVRFPAA